MSNSGLSKMKSAPTHPFTPFSPSPLQDHESTARSKAPAMTPAITTEMVAADPEGALHNEKPSGPVRSGLGNAMFKLASGPTHGHGPFHEDGDKKDQKQD
jgi:hypothetical protein